MSMNSAAKKGSNRIIALDIIRGMFLVIILINHIEMYPSFFDLFTGRGRLLVSAAEGFFFMSGLLVGMVYKRRIANGMKFIFAKMWRRAAELYIASVILTLLFTAAAIIFNHTGIKEGIYTTTNWPSIIRDTLLMKYGFGWADFLDRFAILMFLAPFGFYLLTKGKWWLLAAASLLAWGFRANNFILAWQIIFTLGMMIGYYWFELRGRFHSLTAKTQKRITRTIFAVTAVSFTLSYASVYILSVLNEKIASLPSALVHLTNTWNSSNAYVWIYAQKWTMGPLRIVLFLFWFSALFMLVNRYQTTITKYTWGIVEMLGQNSLFVYVAHAFIVFIFKLFIAPDKPILINFVVTTAALISLIVVTMFYVKYKTGRYPVESVPDNVREKGRQLKLRWAES